MVGLLKIHGKITGNEIAEMSQSDFSDMLNRIADKVEETDLVLV